MRWGNTTGMFEDGLLCNITSDRLVTPDGREVVSGNHKVLIVNVLGPPDSDSGPDGYLFYRRFNLVISFVDDRAIRLEQFRLN